jgi:hypothetical protein
MEKEETKRKQADENKEDKEKKLVMWTGVSFFICLIALLWFLNLENVFSGADSSSRSKYDIDEISREFNRAFDEVKMKMEELEGTSSAPAGETDAADKSGISEKNIKDLKNKLEINSTSTGL